MDYARVCRAIEARSLKPRGAFHPLPADGVPAMSDGRDAATLVLAGVVGGSCWQAFQAAEESRRGPDPLDRWSRRVVGELARELGAEALFPFGGAPFLPFIRWAQRAENVFPSPIGPLIHPDYGLWHAYRGALVFAQTFDLPAMDERPRPCDSCADKPCLTACPVGAFSWHGYDVAACVAHVADARGESCLGGGCLARRACPVGAAYRYGPAQMGFHMRAFVAANRGSEA